MFERTTSEAQIRANRENAQKSTGPKTDEGKQKSRVNAGRHHLTGQVHTMTEEDRAEYDKLLNAFTADYRPEGALMTQLVAAVAHGFWRLNRANAVEENYFALEVAGKSGRVVTEHPQVHAAMLQALTFFEQPEKFVLLSLYEQRTRRKLQKDLKMLLELAAKKPKVQAASAACGAVEPVSDRLPTHPVTDDESMAYEENGFVYSNAPQPPAESPKPPEYGLKTLPKITASSLGLPKV